MLFRFIFSFTELRISKPTVATITTATTSARVSIGTNALLGSWNTKYQKKGWQARYVISRDKAKRMRIHLQSCQWKGCGTKRDSILRMSTDTKYPSSKGWFTAKSLHQPGVNVFVKKYGKRSKVVYVNRKTKETNEGTANRVPKASMNRIDLITFKHPC